MCFEEFSRFLEAVLFTPELIICVDLNFHVDSSSDPVAAKFLDLLDTFNLKKHIKEETHHTGHTLDLVITRSGDHDLISHVSVTDPAISDHYAVISVRYPWQNHIILEGKLIIGN